MFWILSLEDANILYTGTKEGEQPDGAFKCATRCVEYPGFAVSNSRGGGLVSQVNIITGIRNIQDLVFEQDVQKLKIFLSRHSYILPRI